MKKILLILLGFLLNVNVSHTNELKDIPIIKRIDKKYLELIDKDGKITDLKEFNKNGVVVVFEGNGFAGGKLVYLIINTIIDPISGLDVLHMIYTKNIEPYFLTKPAKINFDHENGEHKAPIMNFLLDLDNFSFAEFDPNYANKALRERLSALYQKNQLEEISKIVSGYVICIIRTDNPINETLPTIFNEGCEIEFYDKAKEKQIKNLLNIS